MLELQELSPLNAVFSEMENIKDTYRQHFSKIFYFLSVSEELKESFVGVGEVKVEMKFMCNWFSQLGTL